MTELLETGGGLAVAAVLVVLVGLAAYWVFGPQALGLPAMVGVFALWGLTSLVSDAGLGAIGVLVVVGGVIAVLLVIGMAMSFGNGPPSREDSDDLP